MSKVLNENNIFLGLDSVSKGRSYNFSRKKIS